MTMRLLKVRTGGHDMHTAILMAVASTLGAARDEWKGTLICLFQPAEEFVAGARAMVEDGLYGDKHKVPVPDVVLGQHVLLLKSGTVGLSQGPTFAANDSLLIRVFGRGGHGTRPDLGIDPVLTAAHIVVRLQSIITREVHPAETCVLTVGSIVAGDAANVIPDHADRHISSHREINICNLFIPQPARPIPLQHHQVSAILPTMILSPYPLHWHVHLFPSTRPFGLLTD